MSTSMLWPGIPCRLFDSGNVHTWELGTLWRVGWMVHTAFKHLSGSPNGTRRRAHRINMDSHQTGATRDSYRAANRIGEDAWKWSRD